MRRTSIVLLVGVFAIWIAALAVLVVKYRGASASAKQLQADAVEAEQRYVRTIDAIAEIQDSLNAIPTAGGTLHALSPGYQSERALGGPSAQEALERVADLRSSIQRSRVRIRELESELQRSGAETSGLKRMLSNLKRETTDKEAQVAMLSLRVDSLQTQVAGLNETVVQTESSLQESKQTLEARRQELATVYIAMGTKSELAHAGILRTSGGLLGMGRSLQPTGEFVQAQFKPLDTDAQSVVQIASSRARVISAQPPSSYRLIPSTQGLELHILDAKEFRRVRELVIVTA